MYPGYTAHPPNPGYCSHGDRRSASRSAYGVVAVQQNPVSLGGNWRILRHTPVRHDDLDAFIQAAPSLLRTERGVSVSPPTTAKVFPRRNRFK